MKEKNKKLIVLLLIVVITVSSAVAMVVIFRSEDKPQPVSVSSLSVKSYLTKKYYLPNEQVLFDGCVLTINYSDGKTEDVTLSDERLSVRTTGTAVDEKVGFVKVTLDGATASVPYMVSTKYDQVTFDTEGLQTVYTVGNSVAWGASKFDIKKRGSTSTTTVRASAAAGKSGYNFSLDGFSTEIPGVYKMKITFMAEVYETEYKVVGHSFVKSVALSGTPRTVYLMGEELDVGNLKIMTETSTGETAEVEVTKDMFSGFDTSEVGENKAMKLFYKPTLSEDDKTFEITFGYTVYDENRIESVDFVASAGELNYYVGDEIKLSQSKLRVKFAGGVIAEISVTDPSVKIDESTFDTSKGGRYKLKIIYTTPNGTEFVNETEYVVTARVVKMEVKNAESMKGFYQAADGKVTLAYRAGDTFGFGDAYVLVTYDDGSEAQFNLQEQLEKEEGRMVILLSMPDRKKLTVSGIDMTTQRENEIYIGWAGGKLLEVVYVITA